MSLQSAILEAQEFVADPPPNESSTCDWVVLPLLWAAGYARREIHSQVADGVGAIPDYTVLAGDPERKWYVEAKAWKIPLDHAHVVQSLNYANQNGVRWVVLTNGRTWRLYDNDVRGMAADKLSAEARLDRPEELGDFLRAVGRESMRIGEVEQWVRAARRPRAAARSSTPVRGAELTRARSTSDPPLLAWLGDEGEELREAFHEVFGERVRPFGSRATGVGGLSDGHAGVQWNAWADLKAREARVGVNLEGLQYDGWPIARLITRELRNPTLPTLIDGVPDLAVVELLWRREYWQASARPAIVERMIAPTPIALGDLTTDGWRQSLEGALSCLDSSRGAWKRATQEVTLAASGRRVRGGVSPHLKFSITTTTPQDWLSFLRDGRERMQRLYDWATARAAGGSSGARY